MMRKKHTYTICAYKESDYLEECVKSLLNQTVKSKLLISTSTDNYKIRKVAEKYNIPLYTHTEGGIGKDWNVALSYVDTKYVTIAHQDDLYKSNYTEKIVSAMEENINSIIGFSNYREIKNGIEISKGKNLKIKEFLLFPLQLFQNSRFVRKRILSLGSPICCPAVTYNMEKIKDFKFSETLTVSLDWEAWYRLSILKGSFVYVPEDLMDHRIHEGSETTNAIAENKRTQEDLMMYKKFWPTGIANLLMRFYVSSQNANQE